MKKIVFFFTGGTISMRFDPTIGGAVPALSGTEIIAQVEGLERVADAETVDFGRYPGPHWSLKQMMELGSEVRATLKRPEVDGVVITHGTDTLEETSYLLDLTTQTDKPVVFTGAMRNSSEPGWDGPSNLMAATRTACSDAARGLGVVVVMNDRILAASEVAKTHTESFDSFESPDFGPLGIVDKEDVFINRSLSQRQYIQTSDIAEPVFLLKAAAGMDATLIEACISAGARGIVVEGMGRGNLPPIAASALGKAVQAGIPVIIASRCHRGRVYPSYGYEGGGRKLAEMGFIFAPFLNGQKARIKLALGLAAEGSQSIRSLFGGFPTT